MAIDPFSGCTKLGSAPKASNRRHVSKLSVRTQECSWELKSLKVLVDVEEEQEPGIFNADIIIVDDDVWALEIVDELFPPLPPPPESTTGSRMLFPE